MRKPGVIVKVGNKKLSASNYTVKYAGARKNVGTYTVTVTLKGNYSGSGSAKFTIIPQKTAVTALEPVKGKTEFIVRWKKQAVQTTGYQIQYVTNKNFTKNVKTITSKGANITSRKITGIKAKTYYYVRIRIYKQIGKTKIYSLWAY